MFATNSNQAFMKSVYILLFVLVISNFSQAQTNPIQFGMDTNFVLPIGIPVDTIAPRINTTSITGKKIDTDELIKEGAVVVIFYRGEWCPVCTRYLAELNKSLPKITAKGATVLVISPELTAHAVNTKEDTKSDFIFISDSTLKIVKDYDVLFDVTKKYTNKILTKLQSDIAENNGANKAQLPVPATYIIDKNGKIIYKQFDYNYRNRASAEDILKML